MASGGMRYKPRPTVKCCKRPRRHSMRTWSGLQAQRSASASGVNGGAGRASLIVLTDPSANGAATACQRVPRLVPCDPAHGCGQDADVSGGLFARHVARRQAFRQARTAAHGAAPAPRYGRALRSTVGYVTLLGAGRGRSGGVNAARSISVVHCGSCTYFSAPVIEAVAACLGGAPLRRSVVGPRLRRMEAHFDPALDLFDLMVSLGSRGGFRDRHFPRRQERGPSAASSSEPSPTGSTAASIASWPIRAGRRWRSSRTIPSPAM